MRDLEEILNKQHPLIERNLMQVSMFRRRGRGGEVRAKVRHLNVFAMFWSNSRPLGLENSSNLIKYPHLGITKP